MFPIVFTGCLSQSSGSGSEMTALKMSFLILNPILHSDYFIILEKIIHQKVSNWLLINVNGKGGK